MHSKVLGILNLSGSISTAEVNFPTVKNLSSERETGFCLGFTAIFKLVVSSAVLVHVPIFGELSGSEDRGGGDNSIQFINIGRVCDKSFKECRRKIGGWKGG